MQPIAGCWVGLGGMEFREMQTKTKSTKRNIKLKSKNSQSNSVSRLPHDKTKTKLTAAVVVVDGNDRLQVGWLARDVQYSIPTTSAHIIPFRFVVACRTFFGIWTTTQFTNDGGPYDRLLSFSLSLTLLIRGHCMVSDGDSLAYLFGLLWRLQWSYTYV